MFGWLKIRRISTPLIRSLLAGLALGMSACGGSGISTPSSELSDAARIPTTKTHQLSSVGNTLGQMSKTSYVTLQQKWTGSTEPACNYFVGTALCQNGQCQGSAPDVLAAHYGTYLKGMGWKEIDLDTLEGLFLADADFDVIMQSDGLSTDTGGHGHVLIPVSLGENHILTVAQGELDGVTNEVVTWDDQDLITFDGGMHIWVAQ